MRKLACLLLVILALGTGPALALEPPHKITPPPPEAFVEPDSILIAVLDARPDDAGFQALCRNAWSILKARSGASNSPYLNLLLSFLGGNTQDDVLLSFLPIQLVRVDRLDADGQPSPTLGITVAGWQGLQSLFLTTLSTAPDGQPYPTRTVGRETVVVQQQKDQDPKKARAVARVNGTFANFPNYGVAERIIPRLHAGAKMPEGDLSDVLSTVDQTKCTYGALLNRKGSMWKFLWWLNERDTGHVQQEVGKERLDNVLQHTLFLTWQGDLVNDDQMNLTVRFQTDSDQAADELADVLKQARGTLKKYGRAGDLQLATVDKQVMLDIAMVGYRKMLSDYLNSSTAAK